MIEFKKVSWALKNSEYIDDLSFKIKKWEWIFFVWDDLKQIIDLILWEKSDFSGEVNIFGKKLNNNDHFEVQRFKQNFWIVFHDLKLIPNKTIFENIAYSLFVRWENKDEIKKKVLNASWRFWLNKKLSFYPEELSALERQKASIARALIWDPKILLLDKVMAHLDEKAKRSIMKDLAELKAWKKITVIWMTWDEKFAKKFADKIYYLK